jgi:hypothetical protein
MASSEHLVEALRVAVQALSEAKVPDDLREIAFAKALDHLLCHAASGRRVEGSGEHPGAGGDDGSGGKSVDLGNPLGMIAAKFHVHVQTVERFFEVDDDRVHLLMPTRSLSSKKQQATQEVADLVCRWSAGDRPGGVHGVEDDPRHVRKPLRRPRSAGAGTDQACARAAHDRLGGARRRGRTQARRANAAE